MVNFQSSQCMFLRFSVPLGLHSWKVSRDHAHYEPWLVAWSWFADIWDWSPWLNGEWTLLLHGRGLNSELLQTSHLPPWSLGDPSESLRFSNSRGQSLCSWGVESTQRAGSTVLVPSRHWVGSLFSLVILFSLSSSVFLCLSFSSRFLFFFIPRPLPPPLPAIPSLSKLFSSSGYWPPQGRYLSPDISPRAAWPVWVALDLIGKWILSPVWSVLVNLHHFVTLTFGQTVAPEIV